MVKGIRGRTSQRGAGIAQQSEEAMSTRCLVILSFQHWKVAFSYFPCSDFTLLIAPNACSVYLVISITSGNFTYVGI